MLTALAHELPRFIWAIGVRTEQEQKLAMRLVRCPGHLVTGEEMMRRLGSVILDAVARVKEQAGALHVLLNIVGSNALVRFPRST